MTPQTLEALKGSIEKWRKIVEEKGVDLGGSNCPLCILFNRHGGCTGCPVLEKTGRHFCEGSPYKGWANLDDGTGQANTLEKVAAARAELEFLRSLLPQEEAS